MRNPFAVGDVIVFLPNDQARRWLANAFGKWGLHPGHRGTVTAVMGPVLELDGKAGFPLSYLWCRRAAEVPVAESVPSSE